MADLRMRPSRAAIYRLIHHPTTDIKDEDVQRSWTGKSDHEQD